MPGCYACEASVILKSRLARSAIQVGRVVILSVNNAHDLCTTRVTTLMEPSMYSTADSKWLQALIVAQTFVFNICVRDNLQPW